MKITISLSIMVLITLSTPAFAAGRAPAVVQGQCELDIETNQVQKGSEKQFHDEMLHSVSVQFDQAVDCHAQSLEGMARNEVSILLDKYRERYSKKCLSFYKLHSPQLQAKCDLPQIDKVTAISSRCLKGYGEAKVKVTYWQNGRAIEERSVEVVQKEQCKKVSMCLAQSSDEEFQRLKQLQAVACKGEVSTKEVIRAPAIEREEGYNGERKSKLLEKDLKEDVGESSQDKAR